MNGREQQIYEEVSALWRELYGEPPPIRADGGMMLDIIMRSLPDVGYERLRSPHLRTSAMAFPTRSADEGPRA
ncbi:hypothetical protein DJ021_05510 [Phenylobacterium hankyongense]|uniref:Uncharacterized protein n=1 Tax=Phenylobacterium hankyongense TaxID=1813876 RepID=A0A328B2Q9_9CAUL|nr:hypothetical protein [Phenylobacterium hankyongense]RAK59298.1 hypothetical protein DJ021_05510 [Phenylobacterium hankyongense]